MKTTAKKKAAVKRPRSAAKKKKTAAASKKTTAKAARKPPKKWSKKVNQTSDAMDLQQGVFKGNDAHKIALSLKRSAETSHRRKAGPFASAMSMLNFYENRGGKNLSASRLKTLDRAKNELRELYGRETKAT